MKTNIVICGHICLDLIPIIPYEYSDVSEFISSGELTNIGEMCVSGGGPVFNTGKALGKIINKNKYNIVLSARIGRDLFAEYLRKKCSENKLNINWSVSDKPTAYTLAFATGKMDRSYLHYQGTNDYFTLKDIKFPKTGKPGILHFGYPQLMKKMFQNNGLEMKKIFIKAKKKGYTTSLDLSLVSENSESAKADWKRIISSSLKYVNILFIGMEEANLILDKEDYFKNRRNDKYDSKFMDLVKGELFNMGANLIVLKCGKGGAHIFSKEHKNKFSNASWNNLGVFVEPIEVKGFKNTIGAGDNFAAGFINSYIEGENPRECLKSAIRVASESLKRRTS